ncbi:MAG: 3-keto-disaccharide hydrolase [Flavobacteriaceae bacterium]
MNAHFLYVMGLFSLVMLTSHAQGESSNTGQWIELFDGKTLNGWHQYNGGAVGDEWSVSQGVLSFSPKEKRNWDNGGKDIVTDQDFTSFVLSLEWKISEAGNSGIFWGVKEDEKYREPYMTGPEIQILDNDRHPDALANPKFHQAGALYDLVQPIAEVCKPAGEWNHVILSIDHAHNSGYVVLNGTEIVRFPLQGRMWRKKVKNSKFKGWKGFGKFKSGKIGLQDHGDKVAFRKIKIKKL